MVTKKTAAAADGQVIASTEDASLVLQPTAASEDHIQKAGERGPKSALEGGEGSLEYAKAHAGAGEQVYSVQIHDDSHGLQVKYFPGTSGDQAAQKALAAAKYRGTSIRGVTPASDPDANSMGGERDAAIMFSNATNTGNIINTLGTEANAKATVELAKADVTELGE